MKFLKRITALSIAACLSSTGVSIVNVINMGTQSKIDSEIK